METVRPHDGEPAAAAAAQTAERVERLAEESGVGAEEVWLAAKLKVAAVVTGTPELPGGESWRAMIARLRTGHGRLEAEAAWRAVAEQEHIGPERVAGYLNTAIRLLVDAPDEPHHRSSLLGADELEAQIAASAGPVRPIPDRRLHELVEERVRRHPDRVAAVHGERGWTYDEVNRRANKIAWALHHAGLEPEDAVAVVAERSLEWLAAVLGVLKAGGCYLPLDPGFPAARVSRVLERSRCRWVLADPGLPQLDEVVAGRPATALFEIPALLERDEPEGDLGLPVAADQLAYIYFTSGSTGEPKGAMCEHGGFLNHVFAKIDDLAMEEGDVVAQTAPQCFDISLWQLVAALLVGGRTLIVGQEVLLDVRGFVETLAAHRVRIAQLVPTYLDVFLATLAEHPRELPDLRRLAVTGEALKKELVHRWFAVFPEVPLVDCYGTTEVSDDTNHGIMLEVPEHRSVPLGTVIRNIRVYVMDEWLNMLPDGAPGEIVFAGVCVGRGYVNDAERTRAVYGRDPYRPEDRVYRSGDFGRRLPTGRLEYLGRRDSQVKVSGFRIEIGEIENRLLQVPGIRDGAVVIAGSAADPQLAAYYTGAGAPDGAQVAKALGEALPEYMVPQRLYRMTELPLNPNGKIDRKALGRLARVQAEQEQAVDVLEAPATATEQRVVRLWSDLLKIPVERIGRGSRFVELGGTSLSAIRLSNALDRVVTVVDLWHTSTVADVAALIDRKAAGAAVQDENR